MKNKKLQKWALGAELVSAVAVVVTIGFLAFQTMDNTNALQAQTYQVLMAELNNWRVSFVEDPSLQEIIENIDAVGWENLGMRERRRFWMREIAIWGIYESAYFAKLHGVLGELEWARFERQICPRFNISRLMWDPPRSMTVKPTLTPHFAEYVEANCK